MQISRNYFEAIFKIDKQIPVIEINFIVGTQNVFQYFILTEQRTCTDWGCSVPHPRFEACLLQTSVGVGVTLIADELRSSIHRFVYRCQSAVGGNFRIRT